MHMQEVSKGSEELGGGAVLGCPGLLGWHEGARRGQEPASSPRQLLKTAFIQAPTAAIKIGLRGNILGEPFPNSKVRLEVHCHEV